MYNIIIRWIVVINYFNMDIGGEDYCVCSGVLKGCNIVLNVILIYVVYMYNSVVKFLVAINFYK